VAASTVSRYLAGQLNVSPATGARLLQAIRDLGYVPNAQARNLPGGARASPASSCRKSATQRRPDREPAGSRPDRPGRAGRAYCGGQRRIVTPGAGPGCVLPLGIRST
jgi:Bacterial regulatory proteins, lacI family